ncbi:hypothetical protein P7H94_11445 [Lactococcus lactis]|uniref:hypothetical protein n=1 Tax=Lactococcus lactis TaxID=1358 RepID=UPI0028927D2B|nr:hypothetical protein [Lactococcus lactis]MDT2922541.1 hypothetical protein [Lactococcus lactis]
MGLFDLFKTKEAPSSVAKDSYTLSSTEQTEYSNLKAKLEKSRISDDEFSKFSALSCKKQKLALEEFKLGKHSIFEDNELSENEIIFFEQFIKKMTNAGLNQSFLKLNRLSDKTLNVEYIAYQIGRVKLQGRKTRMQILKSDTVKWLENKTLEEYIDLSLNWIYYTKELSILRNS